MRSMRMAALAVAITFMFSGLALARDHDHDKDNKYDKHDHWDKHADRVRHLTAIMSGIATAGKTAITTATVNAWNVTIIGGNVIATMTMATIAKGRFTTAIPRAIQAGMAILAAVFIATPAADIPAAGMAIPAQSMAAPATAGTQATASAIRMAATWLAGTEREQAVQSQSSQ